MKTPTRTPRNETGDKFLDKVVRRSIDAVLSHQKLGDHELNDLEQAAWVAALNARDRLTNPRTLSSGETRPPISLDRASAKTYIAKAVQNAVVDEVRFLSGHTATYTPTFESIHDPKSGELREDISGITVQPTEEADQNLLWDQIKQELADADEFEVLRLTIREGKTLQQAAEKLGVSVATAHRLRKAALPKIERLLMEVQ